MDIITVLTSFGVNIASNVFYDFIKRYFQKNPNATVTEFEKELDNFLSINGATVKASTLINAFAEKGILTINNSKLEAPLQIFIGAEEGANFSFINSVSKTNKTEIKVGINAEIRGGNAGISQNPDGSISFLVGKK